MKRFFCCKRGTPVKCEGFDRSENKPENKDIKSVISLDRSKSRKEQLVHLVAQETFQEQLCNFIRQDIQSSIDNQVLISQKRLINKIDSNIGNLELIIINKVIGEVTKHVDNRLEKRIIELENRLTSIHNNTTVKDIDSISTTTKEVEKSI